LHLAEDAPVKFSLTGTGLAGGPLELKIKYQIKKEIAPAGRHTVSIFSHKDMSGRRAARAQNLKKIRESDCACRTMHRFHFL
jgi:hypothetical protein